MTDRMDRRAFLARTIALGCSAAASPLLTPVTFAAAPWDTRLIVIVLRGAMDGIDVVRPLGDPDYARLRPPLEGQGPGLDLDGYFALHPRLKALMPLWRAGELGFVHAVSTPYRDKRSHFTGQDILEAGVSDAGGVLHSDGWLNRMLAQVPGITAETTFAIGRGDMLLTRGPAPVSEWSPEARIGIGASGLARMQDVMHDDPMFRDTLDEAMVLSGLLGDTTPGGMGRKAYFKDMMAATRGDGVKEIARFAAERLRDDARIAAFSLNGWDTHANQIQTITAPLDRLQTVLLTLRDKLGEVWGKTAVVAMTEFGRTAARNGSGGTDHGTGGVMVLAGGAVRGGKVHGDWPGLSDSALYERRDLMPTRDVRAHAAWVMRGLFGLSRSDLEGAVFPGLEMGGDPGLLL